MGDPQAPEPVPLPGLWSTGLPDSGGAWITASAGHIAVGTEKAEFTDVHGSLTILDAHTGRVLHQRHDHWQVHSLAVSPDGRWLAASEAPDFASGNAQPGDADRIRVLGLGTEPGSETGRERCRYNGQLSPATGGLAFSPDGLAVAAVSGNEALVFDAETGQQRWRTALEMPSRVAWRPDSGALAAGTFGGVVVLDGGSGSPRLTLPFQSFAGAVAYSRDGGRIVAGDSDGLIRVFDAGSGVQAWSHEMSGLAVVGVAVSDDDRWVAAAGRDRRVAVYDLASGTPRYPPLLWAFPHEPAQVIFSPTLRHVLAMDWGSTTLVVDARTGRPTGICSGPSCVVPPDGATLAATGSFRVERLDLGVRVSACDVGAPVTSMAMSPAGTPFAAVATAGSTGSAMVVVDAANGTEETRKPVPGTVASLVFADHGQAVVAGGSDGARRFSIVGSRVWRADTIGVVNALSVADAAGEWVATAAGRTVRLLNSVDGHERWASPTAHPQTVTRVASSSDGRWIATGCADRQTRVLDAETGAARSAAEGDGRVRVVAFTPDGALLASANEDGTVILVDPAAASERARVTRPFGCARIAFAFDGTLLAAAWDDNTVTVHDLTTGEAVPPTLRELAFAAPVSGLAFNPVEHTLAIAAEGASVVVHDARDGAELVRILQPAPVSHFAFSADGGLIATAGDDKVVRVWTSGSAPREQEIRP